MKPELPPLPREERDAKLASLRARHKRNLVSKTPSGRSSEPSEPWLSSGAEVADPHLLDEGDFVTKQPKKESERDRIAREAAAAAEREAQWNLEPHPRQLEEELTDADLETVEEPKPKKGPATVHPIRQRKDAALPPPPPPSSRGIVSARARMGAAAVALRQEPEEEELTEKDIEYLDTPRVVAPPKRPKPPSAERAAAADSEPVNMEDLMASPSIAEVPIKNFAENDASPEGPLEEAAASIPELEKKLEAWAEELKTLPEDADHAVARSVLEEKTEQAKALVERFRALEKQQTEQARAEAVMAQEKKARLDAQHATLETRKKKKQLSTAQDAIRLREGRLGVLKAQMDAGDPLSPDGLAELQALPQEIQTERQKMVLADRAWQQAVSVEQERKADTIRIASERTDAEASANTAGQEAARLGVFLAGFGIGSLAEGAKMLLRDRAPLERAKGLSAKEGTEINLGEIDVYGLGTLRKSMGEGMRTARRGIGNAWSWVKNKAPGLKTVGAAIGWVFAGIAFIGGGALNLASRVGLSILDGLERFGSGGDPFASAEHAKPKKKPQPQPKPKKEPSDTHHHAA